MDRPSGVIVAAEVHGPDQWDPATLPSTLQQADETPRAGMPRGLQGRLAAVLAFSSALVGAFSHLLELVDALPPLLRPGHELSNLGVSEFAEVPPAGSHECSTGC